MAIVEKFALIPALIILFIAYVFYVWPRGKPGREVTIAVDNLTLYSKRHLLKGRPDRIVKIGDHYIPEEWKSTSANRHCYHVQLGVYMLLVEEYYGVRPPYGILVLGKGRTIRVPNTAELREEMLSAASQIRSLRAAIAASKRRA